MLDREDLNSLFRYSLSLCADPTLAQDILHSAIEKTLSTNSTINKPLSYLRRVIRNQFIDYCRRQKTVCFEPIDTTDPVVFDEKGLENFWIDNNYVDYLLNELNSAEREILFLWAVEGYSAKEIADYLDAPRGTVLSRLFRIKKKLQTLDQDKQLGGGG